MNYKVWRAVGSNLTKTLNHIIRDSRKFKGAKKIAVNVPIKTIAPGEGSSENMLNPIKVPATIAIENA